MKNKENENELISIIVPIYNVEKYLNRCIDSIINQTYKNLEIILVDDGSTDNSGKICDKYAEKDKRIKVIHKKNGGLSDARNSGIEVEKGKKISFIDSDDFVEKTFIENLYKWMKQYDVDISCCDSDIFFDDKSNFYNSENYKNISKVYEKFDALKYSNIQGYFGIAAWNKLYKSELFKDVRYPIGKICEDWRTTYKLIEKSKKLYYNSTPLYHYRQRKNSITKKKEITYDALDAVNEVIEHFKEKNEDLLPYIYQAYCINCMGIYNKALMQKDKKEMQKSYVLGKKKYNKLSYFGLKKSKKIQIFIFYKMHFLYNYAFRILKQKGKLI